MGLRKPLQVMKVVYDKMYVLMFIMKSNCENSIGTT